jgi:hypothetical protein
MDKDYPLLTRCFGVLVALVGTTWLLGGPAYGAVGEHSNVQLQKDYGKLPLHFIPNQGQTDERVKYYAQGGGYSFFFTRDGVVLSLEGERGRLNRGRQPGKDRFSHQSTPPRPGPRAVVQLNPMGMSPGVEPVAADPQGGKVNYFIGKDPKNWRANLPTYGAVVYREAYPGIDMKFYGNGRQLEYDLVVRPGADPARVKFQYRGIEGLAVTREGDLAIKLPGGECLTEKKPVVYQEITGQKVAREGKFKILDERQFTYGFEMAAYDPHHPLIIDPTLVYSTYLGGSFYDEGYGIAADSQGRAYVTGYTYSIYATPTYPKLFPGLLAQEVPTYASSMVFVTRISPDGTSLDYATFLGGGTATGFNDDSYGNAIVVFTDNNGTYAYVAGGTISANFPTTANAFQPGFGGGTWDAFICKLDDNGTLIYSTFLGGNDLDIARGIATDESGNAYVTGKTFSTNFPKTNLSKNVGGGDAFVAKVSADLQTLQYSTYLGGSGDDAGNGIAVDGSGNAYVAGETDSRNFPTTFLPGRSGGKDAFVTKFDLNGTRQYSVRLGGSKYDAAEAVAVDGSGHAYVTGYTYSGTGFPTTNALQAAAVVAAHQAKGSASTKGGGTTATTDAFVTKLNIAGNALDYSVLLGGSNDDYGYGIAVDAFYCAYVTGGTRSANFVPSLTRLIGDGGGREAFVIKLNPNGTKAYAASLAGNSDEEGSAIALDGLGSVYLTGYTYSTNLATTVGVLHPVLQPYLNNPGGDSSISNGSYDGFVARISDAPPAP